MNILDQVLEILAENAGVKFLNLCNPLDEGRINEAFHCDPNAPLVIVGLEEEDELRRVTENETGGLKLKTVLSRPRTVYVKVPCECDELQKALSRAKTISAQASSALEMKAKIEEAEKQVRYLKHLKAYQERNTRVIGQKARTQYGWEGTDEEIIARLDAFRPEREMAIQFSGQTIPGVFADVEGTLLDWNGDTRPEIIGMLEKHAAEGKPVALWSGGDPKEIGRKLAASGIDQWPLLSKYDFRGCTVEIAIDDLPEEKLLEDYGIWAENYVRYAP